MPTCLGPGSTVKASPVAMASTSTDAIPSTRAKYVETGFPRAAVRRTVTVTRVKTLAATLKTTVKLGKVKVGKGRKAVISGRVLKNGGTAGLSGKVRVAWQQKRGKTWKTIHGGLKPAKKPFVFRQKLKKAGSWRAQVTYLGVAP